MKDGVQMSQLNIIITVNSPGEVSGWLKPAVAAIKALMKNTFITVFIPPCTFASGSECKVVRSLPEVNLAIGPGETLGFVLLGRRPRGFLPSSRGIVIFLGGDLTYAALLSKRLDYTAIAYTEGLVNWEKSFAYFMVPYPKMGHKALAYGAPESKLRIIGNLMLDAVKPTTTKEEVRRLLKINDRPLLLLMPGSRPAHLEYMAAFFLQVAELVAEKIPDLAVVFSISPFVSDRQFQEAVSHVADAGFGVPGEFMQGEVNEAGITAWESPAKVKTGKGLSVQAFRGRQYDLMAAADLAITIPGTNTAELSFFGTPTVLVLPLNYPERIPVEGPLGLIGGIPFLGKALKRALIPKLSLKTKYTAWPNMLAEEHIVPEVRGKITARDVSKVAEDLLLNEMKRFEMKERLKKAVGEKGAAERLVGVIQEVLVERYK